MRDGNDADNGPVSNRREWLKTVAAAGLGLGALTATGCKEDPHGISLNKAFGQQQMVVLDKAGKVPVIGAHRIYKIPKGLYELLKSGEEPTEENVRKACHFIAPEQEEAGGGKIIGFFFDNSELWRKNIESDNFQERIKELKDVVSSREYTQTGEEQFTPPIKRREEFIDRLVVGSLNLCG